MSTMRIGGLASGMDIDSIVEKLMLVERAPLDKLEQQKQTYEWQRDAYRDINTKLKTFDTYITDNFILKSLNSKTATTSNSDLVEAIATSTASGTLSIEGVTQLATAARKVGNIVNTKIGTVATGSTKISELKDSEFTGKDEFSILIKSINKNGKLPEDATEIKFKATDTIDQIISKINSSGAGVVAFFENGQLSLTAANTGKLDSESQAEIQLVNTQTKDGKTVDAIKGNKLFSLLGLDYSENNKLVDGGTNSILRVNGIDIERSSNNFTLNGYSIKLKDTFNTKEILGEKIAKLEEIIASLSTTESQLNQQIKNLEIQEDYNLDQFNTSYLKFVGIDTNLSSDSKKFIASLSEEQLTMLTDLDKDLNNPDHIGELGLTGSQLSLLEKLDNITREQINTYEKDSLKNIKIYEQLTEDSKNILIGIEDEQKLMDLEIALKNPDLSSDDAINESGLTDDQKQLLLSFKPDQRTMLSGISLEELKNLQTTADGEVEYKTASSELSALKEQLNKVVSDKKSYNDQLTEANTHLNNFVDTTVGKTVTLTSTTNVDEIMNKIKEFVTTYNGLITDLKNKTSETKYRDFKPLTSLQRKEMEEKEIELWEEKAKSGLLRGDTIIENGLSSMRGLIYESNPAISNMKYNTLFSIGITTSKDYMSGGTLEINENKLREALEADPDAVTQLFTFSGENEAEYTIKNETKKIDTNGFLRKLRTTIDTIENNIDKRAGKTSWNETQFTLGNYLRDVNNRIESWEDKLVELENRYWRQFTAMETMINKANNQSAMLMNQFY